MLNRELTEAYKKIKPAGDLKQHILSNINEQKHEEKQRILWNKPILACASIIVLMFVVYCTFGMFSNGVHIYDINGKEINQVESVMPTFDLNSILNRNDDNDISSMSIKTINNEYISTILQLELKENSDIYVESGKIFVIEKNQKFVDMGTTLRTNSSIQICWGFESQQEDFTTKMHIISEKEESIINLKYENSIFSIFVSK